MQSNQRSLTPAKAEEMLKHAAPATASPFLQARGTKLYFGETEYRAIGFNMPYVSRVFTGQMDGVAMPDCFLHPPEDSVAKLEDAAQNGLAFLRVGINPCTAAENQWYWNNKGKYWRRIDEFMLLCRRLNIKLIVTLNAFPGPEYQAHTGEPRATVLDATSKNHKLIYDFVTEAVSRYKDDPNILMWEIANELFLKADQPNPNDSSDQIRFDQLREYYCQLTTYIKQLDSNHLVTSGDANCREESMSRRLGKPLQPDNVRDHLANTLNSQPEPLDVFSFHSYGPLGPGGEAKYPFKDQVGNRLILRALKATDYLLARVRVAHAANLPVFVGELGQAYPFFNEDTEASWTCEMIDRLEAEQVSLIALWVWRFPEQPEHTFDAQSHPGLVQRAVEFNRKYNALPER